MATQPHNEPPDEVAQLQTDLANAIADQAHPWLIAARQELLDEALERAETNHEGMRQLRKAILLAPTIELCEALLRGEQVPRSKLRAEWVKRLETRRTK